MKIFGFTGGTGTGKTTAMSVFNEMGGVSIDADVVYHDLLKTSKEMVTEISDAFPGVFENGELNRQMLGEIVFNDKQRLAALNKITHKYVTDKVNELLKEYEAQGVKYAAVDGVEIIESGIAPLCSKMIAVTAPLPDRLIRIMGREGISMNYAALRIAAQKPDTYYKEHCDVVIMNDFKSIDEFKAHVREIFKELFKD